jgi:hypothetical protein
VARRSKNQNPAGFASLDALAAGKCADCMDLRAGTPKTHSHGICPDCLDRGALHLDGRVITEGGELRGATQSAGRRKRTAGCDTCKGTGAIPLYGKARNDPYADTGWLVRG